VSEKVLVEMDVLFINVHFEGNFFLAFDFFKA
jgi:hypothetical protein